MEATSTKSSARQRETQRLAQKRPFHILDVPRRAKKGRYDIASTFHPQPLSYPDLSFKETTMSSFHNQDITEKQFIAGSSGQI